ncbi:MAG TPA: DsrE family protein [Steroidobacteraceae bacterium]|jgi:intracellular sulfur oxidation DsrE/DsrF family protein|nr:DsrE family protein [Steroidobacteraceae bacterium]
MGRIAALVVVFAGTFIAGPVGASDDSGLSSAPAIEGYGKMHPLPKAAYQPDPRTTYKVVFAMTAASKAPEDVNPAIERVARAVNLYVSAGVPLNHLKFVAVAYGAATSVALDDAHYKAAYGVANPNLPVIARLRKAGIDVAVCGQAVLEHNYEYAWIDPSVTVSLAAITTITLLEQQGYSLMPLF